MSASPTDLTHSLSGVLPAEFHPHIPSLVQQLTALVTGTEPSAQGSGLTGALPLTLLQALAGQQIDWGKHRLTFEASPHLGAIQIQNQTQSTVRQCTLVPATVTHAQVVGAQGQVSLHDATATGVTAGQIMDSTLTTTINMSHPWYPPPPDALESLPPIDHLVERPVEYTRYAQQLTTEHLAIIIGMPGVGKTALAAQLARQHTATEHIFWYTCLSTDGVFVVCKKLAAFLAQRGEETVWRFIYGQSTTPTATEVLDYLPPLLGDQGYLLCLDNLHWLDDDPALPMLLTRLRDLCAAQRIKLILISRHMPSGWDVLLPPLRGLSRDDTVALLQARHLTLDPALLDTLQTVTMGNAKLLELAIMVMAHRKQPQQVLDQLAAQGHIGGYLQREIYGQLDQESQQVMQALAVLGDAGGTCAAVEAVLGGQRVQHILWTLVDRSFVDAYLLAETSVYRQHTLVQLFCYNTLHAVDQQMMHDRAGQYYTRQLATTVLGADHLLRAGACDTAVEVLTTSLTALINHGAIHGVQRLLEQLERQQVSGTHRAAVHTALGEVYRIVGQVDKARECLQLALQHPTSSDAVDGTNQVQRYRLLALLETHTGHYAEAQAACATGLRVAAWQPCQAAEHAHLYAQLAEILLRQSDYDAAEQACQDGLTLLPPEPAAAEVRATLWQRWGTIKAHLGSYDQAIEVLIISLRIAHTAEQTALVALILHNLGGCLLLAGKLDQAVVCYTRSLALKTRLGDRIGQVPTLLNQGSLLILQGNYPQALQSLHQAYTQAERYHMAEYQAITRVNIGVVYLQQGQLVEAKTHIQHAYGLSQALDDTYGCADCLYRLGDITLLEHNLIQARAYGEQALAVARPIQGQTYIAGALRVIGEACIYQGELDAATTYLDHARRVHATLNEPYNYVLLVAAQVRLALAQGQEQVAQSLVQEGQRIARTGQSVYHIALMERLAQHVASHESTGPTPPPATVENTMAPRDREPEHSRNKKG